MIEMDVINSELIIVFPTPTASFTDYVTANEVVFTNASEDALSYNWSFGGGIRYQLGNEYDDVFPWFFDISLVYTRYNINTTAYKINTISQPKGEGYWNDLKFGSLDVIMRFGYRLRFKK